MLPGVLVFTVLADYALRVCVTLLAVTAVLVAYSMWRAAGELIVGNVGYIPYAFTTLPFVTATRTYTNLLTAIAILAVDFSIFPRRFAKTETYGTGLMDIGVGLFVLAHGITSPEARGKSDHRLVCVCVCVCVCAHACLHMRVCCGREGGRFLNFAVSMKMS